MSNNTKSANLDAGRLDLAVALLRRLAAPGAFARMKAETVQIYSPLNRFTQPLATISAEMLEILRQREWIEARDGEPGGWRISELGRSFLRRQTEDELPFRAQHQLEGRRAGRAAAGECVEHRVNEAETPLGWLLNRCGRDGKSYISREQFDAGEQLRRDFTLAQMTPRVTAAWGMPVSRGARGAPPDPGAMADAVIAAKKRYFSALDAAGPGLAEVAVQICCHLQGLEAAERHLGWPSRSGKVVLSIALDRLAEHYRLAGRSGGKNKLHNT